MTDAPMILLGPPGDQVSVPDGASVPLNSMEGRPDRGTIHLVAGAPVLRWQSEVGPCASCALVVSAIDLTALRRELAPRPKTVGGWTLPLPADLVGERFTPLALWLQGGKPGGASEWWTHRPGSTPEKQAAFDEAVEAVIAQMRGRLDLFAEKYTKLFEAARALGYGESR